MNPHEELARQRKVDALVRELDVHAMASGLDSLDRHFAAAMAMDLRARPARFWVELARNAKVKAPSDQSIQAVIARFEERATATERPVEDAEVWERM